MSTGYSFIPLYKPYIGESEKAELLDTLDSGWLSTGPKVKEFELAMQEYIGAEYVLALSSCTAGLHLALIALDIKPGDEVIVPTFTFVSTINVIVQSGAMPVFADIHPKTFNITSEQVQKLITPKTKAIIVVHYAGHPCDLDAIKQVAGKIPIIEDSAHAIGSKYKGRMIGSNSDIAVFSFYATKTMTTGEGGLLVTSQENIAKRVSTLRLHGISKDAWKRYSKEGSWFYEMHEPGYKYNMTDMQAALGICQLRRLEWFITARESICQRYDEDFAELKIQCPASYPHIRHSRYIYPILVDDRDKFISNLRDNNIGTSVHFIPVHLQPYYKKHHQADCPVAEKVYSKIVSLPLYPHMSNEEVNRVIKAVRNEGINL